MILIQIALLIEKCISLVLLPIEYIPIILKFMKWFGRSLYLVVSLDRFYTNAPLRLIQYINIVRYTHIIQHRHTRSYYHGRYSSCTTTLRVAAAKAPSIATYVDRYGYYYVLQRSV